METTGEGKSAVATPDGKIRKKENLNIIEVAMYVSIYHVCYIGNS